ncbi:MAG TPA: sigma-54 dependent transcriptional regulator [Puia sp.]|uniref:sigma-54-dependent transcriptional regulator n=1 Tax=Puia sp. TaxID=2045100 RepID=UPI002C994A6E|nr:sigma-54 dependent transcriptional regulator [Puia sp.]HVU99553.1 sigma-54 dependent transcriptional regulator [Puia sp.]
MTARKILIVEDQFIEASDLRQILERAGHKVCGFAASVKAANEKIRTENPEFVFVDIFLKGTETGIDLAHQLREQNIPFIYLSANSDQATLEAARATHPYGFLVKPFRERDILATLDIAIYRHSHDLEMRSGMAKTRQSGPAPANKTGRFPGIIGKSPEILHVLDEIDKVAPFDSAVLITGETGTGKERLVDAIHRLSPRKGKPLIKVNCAAIPPELIESELFGHEKGAFTGAMDRRIGKFELADGGTIFLDEIGEVPTEIQVKLLRVLQEKEIERVGGASTIHIDVRIVAATNRDLYKEMADGRFRIDLFYRIHVFPIHIPPLRERREDIRPLAEHFLAHFASKFGRSTSSFSTKALRQLSAYSWPGNIRELEHLIERHVLSATTAIIDNIDLPEPTRKRPENTATDIKSIEEMEKAHILEVLRKCHGKVSGAGGAAELLQIPPTTLTYKIKRLGIVWQYS